MLVGGGHAELREDQDEDEDVVDRQRLLEHVRGQIRDRGARSAKPEDDEGERIKVEIVDTSLISDPEAIYALIECINRLPSRYREQVLAELNCGDNHNPDISEVNIRVMRLRAKQMLAKCLQGVNL